MNDKFSGQFIRQPKKDIMTYLKKNGINVPNIYDSVEDGIIANKRIMFRSEHPQDYEGSSNLFNSYLNERLPDITSEKDIINTLKDDEYYMDQIKLHCDLLNIDFSNFIDNLSYSAWDYIQGKKILIVADSAIENRYHIVSITNKDYSIYENGQLTHIFEDKNRFTIENVSDLVSMYEDIRGLLDWQHCYLIEAVIPHPHHTTSQQPYALQVHKGVDFRPSEFRFKELIKSGYVPLPFVRGATPEIGEELILTLNYPKEIDYLKTLHETASFEIHRDYVPSIFSEIKFRQRKLQLLPDTEILPFYKNIQEHSSRSALFKPENSAVIDEQELLDAISRTFGTGNEPDQINVHYISDGIRGFLRILD